MFGGSSSPASRTFQAAGHQAGQARALNSVGWYHSLLGEHQQALNISQQALTLHQQLDDSKGQASDWDSLGYAYHHLGQYTQAVTCYQHALALYRDVADRYGQADTLAASATLTTPPAILKPPERVAAGLGHPR